MSVSALCANQPLLFFFLNPPPQKKKNPDSPQKCTNTSGGRAPGATGPLCLFACSEIAPCLCCDIRCRVWLEVFQNACVLPRTSPPPQRFRLELSLRVDGTAWLRTPCYASPAVPALSPEQRAVEEPLSRNIRQLWRFRGSSPETNKLANAAIRRLAGAAQRRISVPAATAPRRPTMYFI